MAADFDFTDQRAELESERNSALGKLPAARQAYTDALRAHEDAQKSWNVFCARLNRAFSGGAENNQIVSVTPVIGNLIADKRREYDRAGAVLSRAKADVENLRWIVECRNLDLEQLDLLEHPAKPPILPAVPRTQQQTEDVDSIVFPSGRTA